MPRFTPEAKAKREDARRTQILAAAARVFARKGFDRATIAEIAQAAGLSEGSIYNYFTSKEELLLHIPRQLIQPVLQPLLGGLPVPDDPAAVERLLRSIVQAMVQRVREHASFLKVFLSALPTLSRGAREKYMQLLPPIYAAGVLEEFFRKGIAQGVFRSDLNPAVAARTLPGMLMMFVMMQEVLLNRRMTPYGYDAIVREAVRVFLYGAVPREAGRPGQSRVKGGRR